MEDTRKIEPETPETAPTPETEVQQETVPLQWKDWAIKGGIAVAIVLAVVFYRTHKQSSVERASRALGEARNLQSLQDIVAQYPSTPAAQLAKLQIAKVLYDSGDFLAASGTYQEFLSRTPKHAMAGIAELGKIQCLEGMGRFAEALTAYAAFAAAHTNSHLTPPALFGKGRCLEQTGRNDEARAVYEDFLAANPKSPWKRDAEESLQHLNRQSRKDTVRR